MATFVDGATACAILLAMALSLSLPKLLMDSLVPTLAGLPKEGIPSGDATSNQTLAILTTGAVSARMRSQAAASAIRSMPKVGMISFSFGSHALSVAGRGSIFSTRRAQ
jgi:hypothetical protein